MMTHDDISELLASYALDAVGTIEQSEIEAHLTHCPRCRAELDAYREVASAMGNSVEPLPEGLWSGIAGRLPDRADDVAPPMPRLVHDERPDMLTTPRLAMPSGASASTSERRRRARFSRGPLATVGSFAVAAAAVAAVLGIGLVHADDQINQNNAAGTANAASNTVVAALETPGHKVINLASDSHARMAQFVMVPDGRGYLVKSSLPKLSGGNVYQLWAIIDQQPISLGILGSDPKAATFTVDTSHAPSQLSVTEEPAGGSVVPTGSILATGPV